jgi:hypothetical protein
MICRCRLVGLVMAFCLSPVVSAFADVTLSEAVEIAVQGRWADEKTQSITLNGHGFYIRPVAVTRTSDGVTAEGFFRHRHRGKDDRVYYSIVAKKGQPYKAVLTRIHYRGLLDNSVVELGVEAAGATANETTGAGVAKAILEILKKLKLQRLFDGSWEPQAAKIVDAIGARLVKDVN